MSKKSTWQHSESALASRKLDRFNLDRFNVEEVEERGRHETHIAGRACGGCRRNFARLAERCCRPRLQGRRTLKNARWRLRLRLGRFGERPHLLAAGRSNHHAERQDRPDNAARRRCERPRGGAGTWHRSGGGAAWRSRGDDQRDCHHRRQGEQNPGRHSGRQPGGWRSTEERPPHRFSRWRDLRSGVEARLM